MITRAFSVYDSKAKVFGVPFFMGTVGAAVRAFDDLVNDPRTMVHKHPEDFCLYEVGSFDDATAELSWKNALTMISTAAELKGRTPNGFEVDAPVDVAPNSMVKDGVQ